MNSEEDRLNGASNKSKAYESRSKLSNTNTFNISMVSIKLAESKHTTQQKFQQVDHNLLLSQLESIKSNSIDYKLQQHKLRADEGIESTLRHKPRDHMMPAQLRSLNYPMGSDLDETILPHATRMKNPYNSKRMGPGGYSQAMLKNNSKMRYSNNSGRNSNNSSKIS